MFTAGGPGGSDKIKSLPAAIVADNAKRYWFLVAGTPLVFDSTGREMGSVAAGRERSRAFQYPYDAIVIGDSVVVLDPIAGVAVVIGPDLKWARDVGFEIPVTRLSVVRWPDLLIGTGMLSTPQAVGWPMHRLSLSQGEASILSSFGSGDGQLRAGGTDAIYERVAIGPRGELWSFRRAGFDLTAWDSAQHPLRVLKRRPPWFPESDRPTIGGPREAPSPVISAMQVDSAGLIWVFISVPSETWPSAWPPARPGLVEVSTSSIAFEKLYHTVIEVIDPEKGRVVTRSFTDVWIPEALPNRRAVTYTADSGKRRFSVVSLSIDPGEVRRH